MENLEEGIEDDIPEEMAEEKDEPSDSENFLSSEHNEQHEEVNESGNEDAGDSTSDNNEVDPDLEAGQAEIESIPPNIEPTEEDTTLKEETGVNSFVTVTRTEGTEEEEKKMESEKASQQGSEEEDEETVPTLPLKDYTVVDPSFLDEFESSLEAVVKKEEVLEEEIAEAVEEEQEASEEDKYAVYDLPSTAMSDMYDQICDERAMETTDSEFSEAQLSVRRKREPEPPSTPSAARLNELNYLKSLAQPNLVQALVEAALYQPSRPVEYIAHFLARAGLSREELGMDPDPREIQELVDRHERELERERRRRRSGLVSGETSYVSSKSPCSSQSGPLQGVREKYHTDMAKIRSMTAEKQKERIRRGGKEYKKFECLGPTSLVKGYLPRNTF